MLRVKNLSVGVGVCLSMFLLSACNQDFVIKQTRAIATVPSIPSLGTLPNPSATPVASGTPGSPASLIATDDGPYEIAQNDSLTISIAELISNDIDSRGQTITFVSKRNLSSGTLTVNGAQLLFQPAQDFLGPVTFEYTITNPDALVDTGKVSIFVRRRAEEAMYGHTFNKLYSYNPQTHGDSFIADFHTVSGSAQNIYDIAITSNGVMYGVDGSSLSNIDALTGVVSRIPTPGIEAFGNINGLTALSDGRIVISGNGVAVYNVLTRNLLTLLAAGSYQSSGDIIALPDGFLYLVATGNGGDDRLIRINPSTGAHSVIGSLGHSGVYGIGYAEGILYGFAFDGQVFQINPATGASSNAYSSSRNWAGATTNPVLW